MVGAIDPSKGVPLGVDPEVLVAAVVDKEVGGMEDSLGFDQEEEGVGEVGLGCAGIVGGIVAQGAVRLMMGGVVVDVEEVGVHLREQQTDSVSQAQPRDCWLEG